MRLFLLSLVLLVMRPPVANAFEEDRIDLFLRTMEEIQLRYVDESKVKSEMLLDDAMDGIVKFLDPESLLLNGNEKRELAGIGAEIGVKEGGVTVVDVVEGGPAYESGLTVGDRLLRVDGDDVAGKKRLEVEWMLRGPPGSKVTILWGNGAGEYVEKSFRRAVVERASWHRVPLNGVDLFEVFMIDAKSAAEIKSALASAAAAGSHGVLLDLRRAAGEIDASLDLADCLFDGGELLALGRGVNAKYNRRYVSGNKRDAVKMAVAVLVSPSTRGGAEVLAAALKAFSRAPVVGQRTFGYACRQKDFPVGNGGERRIKLTVERMLTPLSESITGMGVGPDLEVAVRPKDEFDRAMTKRGVVEDYVDRLLKDPPPSFDRDEIRKGSLVLSSKVAEGKLRIEKENELEQTFFIGMEAVLRDRDVDFSRDILGQRKEELISQARVALAKRQMKPDAAATVAMVNDPVISMGMSVLKALGRVSGEEKGR